MNNRKETICLNYIRNISQQVINHKQLNIYQKELEQGKKFQTLIRSYRLWKNFYNGKYNTIKFKNQHLVLAHNKTLAGQLYSEFKEFFPENNVEYFVSYYDYYQPESYIAQLQIHI